MIRLIHSSLFASAAFISLVVKVHGFSTVPKLPGVNNIHHKLKLASSDEPSSAVSDGKGDSVAVLSEDDDDEKTADVVGAQFFGGNSQKEELYDPVEEEQANERFKNNLDSDDITKYNKFENTEAFPDEPSKQFAMKLQKEINSSILSDSNDLSIFSKSGGFNWESPFLSNRKSITNPTEELKKAKEFFRSLDISIVSASSISSNKYEIQWEVGFVWPNAWEARCLLSGESTIVLDENEQIISQTDTLLNGGDDGSDLGKALKSQLPPRFWDVYHLGMTPSAELMQRLPPSSDLKLPLLPTAYKVFDIPPRLVLKPSFVDFGGRSSRSAQVLPNHSFSTAIKTMGPNKQNFIPVSPIEISIKKQKDGNGGNKITWTVPVPPKFSKSDVLPIPQPDEDDFKENIEKLYSEYKYEGRRRVATLSYGGNPQDANVPKLRKKLYDAVIRDGLTPAVDEDGLPNFFFLQNESKACYTDEGLGMAVYEWRPDFANCNEIGIDLVI